MLDFKKPGQNPNTKEKVSSIIGLNEYDCATVKYRPIEFKAFTGNMGKGQVAEEQNKLQIARSRRLKMVPGQQGFITLPVALSNLYL
ncbi:surface-adhesin E family protein [Polynucleobacter necessarius]|uniref:surface-adhesin E family protein n=1 Tax=Polynucleobacter necessarius TaxID=576610 RepID=UPI001E4B32B3|nr:surface-adhesin E family protein [Polynucleobacter necessarius]